MLKAPWVVLPTYNERDNIENLIRALLKLPVPTLQVLVVDDNSPDGTASIVRSLQPQFPRLHLHVRTGKQGLGNAYLFSFAHALTHGADAVVQMDADFSHDPAAVPKLLRALSKYDLVIGSRYAHGVSVINWPLRRLIISLAGNGYARLVTGLPFKDVTGGFKAWRASALRDMPLEKVRADGYGFQIVMNYLAWRRGKKITEVPIIFTERREGQSKMSRGIVWEALWIVWRIRLRGY